MSGCVSAGNRNVALCPGLQQLKDEHVSLLEKLYELKDISVALIEQEGSVGDTFTALTTKLDVFYSDLKPHSEKEEDVLFAMMSKYLPASGGPIDVMEDEHNRARALIHQYMDEIEAEANLSDESMRRLAKSLIQVHAILTDHFAKEENILFPMAERMFSDEEKQILNEKLIP